VCARVCLWWCFRWLNGQGSRWMRLHAHKATRRCSDVTFWMCKMETFALSGWTRSTNADPPFFKCRNLQFTLIFSRLVFLTNLDIESRIIQECYVQNKPKFYCYSANKPTNHNQDWILQTSVFMVLEFSLCFRCLDYHTTNRTNVNTPEPKKNMENLSFAINNKYLRLCWCKEASSLP